MIRYGLSIDPGVSTGVCLFTYGDDQPFRVAQWFQFKGGAERLGLFLRRVDLAERAGGLEMKSHLLDSPPTIRLSALVVERFTPRQNQGFNLSRDDVEPLRGEGVLLGMGLGNRITWREPSQQYFLGAPGLQKAEKKKLARSFLKSHGMLPTGKKVGQPDADDAVSATLHAIGFLRSIKHTPTLEMFR